MGKLIFIIGGARSGKSTHALRLAKGYAGKVAFVATGEPRDAEMKKRIASHKKQRPAHWKTFEEPLDIGAAAARIGSGFSCVIVDCLTLLVSNLLLDGRTDVQIARRIRSAMRGLKKLEADSIVISNEVGLGIVPENAVARRFRDIAGTVNQMAAAEADEVVLMAAGIPLKIKAGEAGG